MKTPKNYKVHLEKNEITEEMLELCLYSVNKRAKNCRDQMRKYRYYCTYDYDNDYEEKRAFYYDQKEVLLGLLKPLCVHRVVHRNQHRHRVYDYQDTYHHIKAQEVIYDNFYYDEQENKVCFKDIIEFTDNEELFLFYQTSHYSFHQPLKGKLEDYPTFDCFQIDLKTEGKDVRELISAQFVSKVVNLIKSGQYIYVNSSINS